MKITISESAAKELYDRIGTHKGYVKINYDSEDCACGSGVFTLLFVTEIDHSDDILYETNELPIVIEKSHLIYLDEELTIDYSNSTNFFQLKSLQQTFNGALPFLK